MNNPKKLIHDVKERALLYMEQTGLNKSQFFDAACEKEKDKPELSAFYKFLNGQNSSKTVLRLTRNYLESKGYWPEIENMDVHLSVIANFFHENEVLPQDLIENYCMDFCYYQHSTNQPGKIATSKLTISKPDRDDMEPTYLVVEEVSSDPYFTEVFKGVLFSKGSIEVMLLRLDDSTHGKNKYGPKMLFSMKTGITNNDDPKENGLRWLAGRLLKTSGHCPSSRILEQVAA